MGPRGGVITTATLRDATNWDQLVTELGQPGLVRHGLRHTALTWMADAGIELHIVQRVAGHQDPAVTARYLHPDVQAMLDAGTAFSAWWSATGPDRPPLGVIEGGQERRLNWPPVRRFTSGCVWSGWRDLNSLPLAPPVKCATKLRHSPRTPDSAGATRGKPDHAVPRDLEPDTRCGRLAGMALPVDPARTASESSEPGTRRTSARPASSVEELLGRHPTWVGEIYEAVMKPAARAGTGARGRGQRRDLPQKRPQAGRVPPAGPLGPAPYRPAHPARRSAGDADLHHRAGTGTST